MESATRGRAKRRHLSIGECVGLSRSTDGSRPLTQPASVPLGGADPSRGLYPTYRTKKGRGEARQQQGIPAFFPVTGVVSSKPQSTVAVKEEDEDEDEVGEDDISLTLLTDLSEDGVPGLSPTGVKVEEGEPQGLASCSIWGCQSQPPCVSLPLPNSCCVKLEVEDDMECLPDTHYGLLGGSRDWARPCGALDDLPEEVLRMVLAQLPAEDLYQSVSRVCHRWRAVVRDPLFVPWKKLYFRYKMRESEAVEEISSILRGNNITRNDDLCVINMLRYASQFHHSTRVLPEEVLLCMSHHRLFVQAEACLKHTVLTPEQGPNPWSALALMFILADGVSDVMELVGHLERSGCLLSRVDVSEFLWFVATLLLAMKDTGICISNRWHYNIFYVLHLMEKGNVPSSVGESRAEHSGWGPGACFQPTHEQQQILSHHIHEGHIVKIMAFAGTGKTSTLVQYARLRPHMRFLYVAFNRSVAHAARQTFPGNVDCKTVHSMAYQAVGIRYQMMKKLTNNLKPFSICWTLPKGHGGFVNAKVVTQTINNFFASDSTRIDVDHVPTQYKNTTGQYKRPDHQEKLEFVNIAQNIWEKMKALSDTKESAYHMTHDGYLKLWHLQRPCLDKYDAIFIDEAQDCNPAILDIMLSQRCGKVLVGDPHQQIYTFRGAVNALQTVPHTHLYYLTQSFRFGPEIAYIGATILEACKKVKKMLVGGNQEGSVTGREGEQGSFLTFDPAEPRKSCRAAILSRCNSTVFEGAVRLTETTPAPRLCIVGGVDSFGLRTILDLWILMQPEEERQQKNLAIRDSFIRRFCKRSLGGYAGLKRYAMETEDRELEVKLAIVQKYNNRIPELVERIYSCSENEPQSADFVLGTVHKSKGLEFDTVIVTDDFTKVPCSQHNLQRLGICIRANVADDEWNLLYVAVTRAKRRLVISKTIENLLTLAGEYFLRSRLTSSLLTDGQPPCCSIRGCHNPVRVESALTMCKIPIRYVDSVDSGGPLCSTCVEQRLGPSAYLIDTPEVVKTMPYTEEHMELPVNVAMLLGLF